MYATCLFCHSALGANEAIEHFPVGKRLAYDAAKGRLWVVCRKCERWNLSPLEERWEAIEEAERAYRNTRKRVATDNIGLARLNDGTDLVRIGTPLRPEFAAWRYGDQFGRRRRKRLLIGGSAAVVGTGLTFVALTGLFTALTAIGGIPLIYLPQALYTGWRFGRQRVGRVTISASDAALFKVAAGELRSVVIASADEPHANLTVTVSTVSSKRLAALLSDTDSTGAKTTVHSTSETLTGSAAHRGLATILAKTNGLAGSATNVASAVELLETNPDPHSLFHAIPNHRRLPRSIPTETARSAARSQSNPQLNATQNSFLLISEIPAPYRLALEMSLHEDSERRALDGQLHELEQRWKEAEEIAAIADDMFLPARSN